MAEESARDPRPVHPRDGAVQALRPLGLGSVRIADGPWAEWQADNRARSIPHGLRWIEKDGVLDNFRRLIGESDAERRGWVFCDTDLYKILEAIAWDEARDDAVWEPVIADAVALLDRTRDADGYLNTFVQGGGADRYGNLTRGHELYSAGHLIQAAVALARTTGDERLLAIARPFADLLVRDFLEGERDDTDGHPQVEMALVELTRHTGDDRYLRLAQRLIDVRGRGVLGPGLYGSTYFQDDVPVREQHDVVGHAVRALYLLCGVVDVAVETGDAELLDVAERQWASMLAAKTYLTGAFGSRFEGEAFGDPYELPPDLVYGESCASIAAFMASWRLLLATGRGRYAELMDRILHNAFSGSTSLTRDRFFYVNPIQRRTPHRAIPDGERPVRSDAPGTRAEWFDVACCPPNIMRTIASLPAYAATADHAGVQLHLHLPLVLHQGERRLEVATRYPDDGAVRVTIAATGAEPWELALRVPSWAAGATLVLDGASLDAAPDADGYARVRRVWTPGDVVVLTLPIGPRFTAPHPAVDAVRGTVAIERGPVVYAVERPAGHPGDDPETIELDTDAPLADRWDPELLGGARVVGWTGRVRDDARWGPWADAATAPSGAGRPTSGVAIPYALWANRGPSQLRVWIPRMR